MADEQKRDYDWDVIVLGGGSGGLGFSRRAGSYGARVAMFEEQHVGGTCVNVGCVPKKMLWTAASLGDSMRHEYEANCWKGGKPGVFDWAEHKQKREAYIQRLHGIYHRNLANDKVTVVESRGEIVDAHTVKDVKTGTLYTTKYIVISTGGKPRQPNIKGSELAIDSDGFFALEHQPKKVAIVGGGYIAVELAGVFNSLGTDTTIITRCGAFLRAFDRPVAETLHQQMLADGVKHVDNTDVGELRRTDSGQIQAFAVQDQKDLGAFDCVVFAIGRVPNVDQSMIDVGIKLDQSGHIEVDEFQRTNIPSILALGDVCGKMQLTPVAIAAGRKLGDRLFGGQPDSKLEYENVPTIMFSHPPVGAIGLTEQQAVQKYGQENVFYYQAKFRSMHYSLVPNSDSYQAPSTFMRLIVAGPEEKVVGVHMLGPFVDEMLQGFGVAVRMGATKKDFDNVVAIHPTSSEELVTLKTRHPSKL